MKIPFPHVPVGEFSIFRRNTASGLFGYRHMQASELLKFPDLSGGDLSQEQRREALDRMVSLQKPLSALALCMHVVALEDFIRDFTCRLTDINELIHYFPNISELKTKTKPNSKPYGRLDKEPVQSFSDWDEVNRLYNKVFGINPIDDIDLPILYDLALIRHTVVHHAAVVRPIDIQRFRYWDIQPNTIINPPIDFVRKMSMFIYNKGTGLEKSIRKLIFKEIIKKCNTDWRTNPPKLIIDLIELFDWFGLMLTSDEIDDDFIDPSLEDYEIKLKNRNEEIRGKLIKESLKKISEII